MTTAEPLTETWAVLAVEMGISRDGFERLRLSEVEALQRAVMARMEREQQREARLFAMICNRTGDGKKVWTPEDFLQVKEEVATGPEAEEAVRAYWAAVGGVPSDQ